ncbi:MAG: DUF4160 domain-containing protein [Bacillota bacterium]
MSPTISSFDGIRIYMNTREKGHQAPHFHAEYAGMECVVDIRNQVVLAGSLPRKQLLKVLAWAVKHEDELMENWLRLREGREIILIEPLR